MAALALVEEPPVVVVAAGSLDDVNELEVLIVSTETDADALLWEQAKLVVELLDSGMSQRKLAKLWFNVRKKQPYTQTHVKNVALCVREKLNFHPRPRFRDVYNEISNRNCFGSGDDEWYTRTEYIEAARRVLGSIDLDPASNPVANADVVKAPRFFTIKDDGLSQHWSGRVWMNPPYSRAKIGLFVDKLVAHVLAGNVNAAVVLVRLDTATSWFVKLSSAASAVCLPTHRLSFWKPGRHRKGTSNFGTAFFYFGSEPQRFEHEFRQFGPVWWKYARETILR